MSNDPLISIIVPVYKVEKYLDNCVQSVLMQSYTNWELILVDDGSPDRSGEICEEYARKDNRVVVLHQKNAGLSSARNSGLDYPPSGNYLTFLDSDDFWHKDYLKVLIELAVNHNADIVQCDFIKGVNTVFPIIDSKVTVVTYDNHSVFVSERANIVMWGKLYRSDILDGIRMPVGLYNEDDWTMWKLYYRAKKIVYTSAILYYYTVNPSSTMARLGRKPDLRYINAYNERIAFFKKTGEKDLEHCSRLQLCKSLVLTFRNKQLTKKEKQQVKQFFDGSWKELKGSPYIRKKYKILFSMFHSFPLFSSNLASKLHSK